MTITKTESGVLIEGHNKAYSHGFFLTFGRNTPWFQMQRSKCGHCVLFHVPFVSLALVRYDG